MKQYILKNALLENEVQQKGNLVKRTKSKSFRELYNGYQSAKKLFELTQTA